MIDFIYPLYLILIAVAAVPLIIHLMQRYRARVVGFSSVDLITGAERRTIRWIRLRQILLLLMRIVIILLVVMALAHPLVRGVLPGGIETHLPTSVVIVVDNSLSMGWTDNGKSLLDRSLDRARQVMDELNDNDRCALLVVPDPAEAPLKFEGREEITRVLGETVTIPASPDLSRMIGMAYDELREMPGPGREIHVYTDLHRNAFDPGKEAGGGIGGEVAGEGGSGKPEPGDDVRLVLLTEREAEVWNRAITGLALEEAPISPDGTIYLEVEVSEQGPLSLPGDFYLRVDLEDGENYVREVPLDGSGKGTLRIPLQSRQGGTVRGRVEIDPDPLDMDNRRYFTVQLPGRPRVWYLSDREPPSPLGTALRVLGGESGSIDLRRKLPDIDLDYRDVIVVESPHKGMMEDLVPVLSRGIREGSVILLPPDSESDIRHMNGILGMLGLPDRYLDPVGAGRDNYVKVEGWSSMSGGLDRFVREYSEDLSGVRFFQYYSIHGEKLEPGSRAETIDFETGEPWVVMKTHGKGWRLLFSSGFGREWNDFHRRPLFVPFIDTLLRDIVARGRLVFANFAPGRRVEIDLPGVVEGAEVDLIGPEGERRRVFSEGRRTGFKAGTTAGNYRLEVLDEEVAGFSVNPDGRESVLDEMTVEEIKAAMGGITPTVVRAGARLEESVLVERGGRDIGWELLALALLLLIVEGTVANRGNRG